MAMQRFLEVFVCFAIIAPAVSLDGGGEGNIIGYDGKEVHYGEAHKVYDPVLHKMRTKNSQVRLRSVDGLAPVALSHHTHTKRTHKPSAAYRALLKSTAERINIQNTAKKSANQDFIDVAIHAAIHAKAKQEPAKAEADEQPAKAEAEEEPAKADAEEEPAKAEAKDEAEKGDDAKAAQDEDDKADDEKAEEDDDADAEQTDEEKEAAEEKKIDEEAAEKKAALKKAAAKKAAEKKAGEKKAAEKVAADKAAAKKAAKKAAKAAAKKAKASAKKTKAEEYKAKVEKAADEALKGMHGENGAPSQGFRGEIVEHENDVTMTHDWMTEYGPHGSGGHHSWSKICREYPGNAWCKYNLRKHQQHKSAATMPACLLSMLVAAIAASQ